MSLAADQKKTSAERWSDKKQEILYTTLDSCKAFRLDTRTTTEKPVLPTTQTPRHVTPHNVVLGGPAVQSVLSLPSLLQSRNAGVWSYLHYIEVCRSCVRVCKQWAFLTPTSVRTNWIRDWNLVNPNQSEQVEQWRLKRIGKPFLRSPADMKVDVRLPQVPAKWLARIDTTEVFRFPLTWLTISARIVYTQRLVTQWNVSSFNLYDNMYILELLEPSSVPSVAIWFQDRLWMALLGHVIKKLCIHCGLMIKDTKNMGSSTVVHAKMAKRAVGKRYAPHLHETTHNRDGGTPAYTCDICRKSMVSVARAMRYGVTETQIRQRGCLLFFKHYPQSRVPMPFIRLEDFDALDAPRQRLLEQDDIKAHQEFKAKMDHADQKRQEAIKRKKTFVTEKERKKHEARLQRERQRRAQRTPEQREKDRVLGKQRRLKRSLANLAALGEDGQRPSKKAKLEATDDISSSSSTQMMVDK